MIRLTTQEFINKANEVHKNFYLYDKTEYKKSVEYVVVSCPIHGGFNITPNAHLSCRQGCLKCKTVNRKRKINTEEFIKRAKEIHSDTYDYTNTEYKYALNPVTITCRKHGDFAIIASAHINSGKGCRKCGVAKCAEHSRKTTTEFITGAKLVRISYKDELESNLNNIIKEIRTCQIK